MDPLIGAALISGGSQIAGGLIGGIFGNKAADAQADAYRMAMERMGEAGRFTERVVREAGAASLADLQQYADKAVAAIKGSGEKSAKYLEPYRETGEEALVTLADLVAKGPGAFKESPGYQFRLQEGVDALERTAAAKGRQLSGRQMKDVLTYGQELASTEYDNFLNRYYKSLQPHTTLAQMGLTAAGKSGDVEAAMGGSLAGLYGDVARASSNIRMGVADALSEAKWRAKTGAAEGGIGAAQARASGYQAMGGLGQTIGNWGSQIGNYMMLQDLLGPSGGGGTGYVPPPASANPDFWAGNVG